MSSTDCLTIEMVNAMTRREMQQHCKALKIRANTKNDVMRQALIDWISSNVSEEKIVEKIVEEEKVIPEEKKEEKVVMSDVTNKEVVVEKEVEKEVEKQVVETEQEDDLVEALENLNLPFEGRRTVFTTPEAASRTYKVHWTMDDYEKKENSNLSPDPSTYSVHWTMDDYDNKYHSWLY